MQNPHFRAINALCLGILNLRKTDMFIRNFILALRPKQWSKNAVIFIALVFSQNMFSFAAFCKTLAAFGIFCLLSGGAYVLNDIADIKSDRNHPEKSKRPIASGALSIRRAKVACVVIMLPAVALAFLTDLQFGLTAIAYLAVQLAYSFFLKHLVIIDIFCIASSFFLRVIAGAFAIDVLVSSWLLVCTFFISLFIALCKRRHEMLLLEDRAVDHRKVLEKYDVLLLDQMISVVTASSVVAYSVYTLSSETVHKLGTTHLKYTIPFVLYGIYRYLYLVYCRRQGGSPETILLADIPMIVNLICYGVMVVIVLYT